VLIAKILARAAIGTEGHSRERTFGRVGCLLFDAHGAGPRRHVSLASTDLPGLRFGWLDVAELMCIAD